MRALDGSGERDNSLRIEALRFTLMSCQLAFNDLLQKLRSIEGSDKPKPPFDEALRILSLCWQIVDTADRARELCGHIRGLKKGDPKVQLFLRRTKPVERFRDAYQHLATDIPARPEPSQPTMGSLGWVTERDPLKSCTLWVGGGYRKQSAYGLAFDTHQLKFAHNFQLSVGNADLHLDRIVDVIASFSEHFEAWLDSSQLLSDQEVEPSIMRWNVELRPQEDAPKSLADDMGETEE